LEICKSKAGYLLVLLLRQQVELLQRLVVGLRFLLQKQDRVLLLLEKEIRRVSDFIDA